MRNRLFAGCSLLSDNAGKVKNFSKYRSILGNHILGGTANEMVERRLSTSSSTVNLDLLKDYKGNDYTQFHQLIDVRWIDHDQMGHVNNATYFTYFEICRVAFFTQRGIELNSLIPEGPILSETSCSFKRPAFYPDVLICGSRTELTGVDTFSQHFLIVSQKNQHVVAHGVGKCVNYDYQNNRKIPFSKDMLRKLQLD